MPVIDLGRVIGPQGPQGAQGAQGQRGEQGFPGPNIVGGDTATTLTGVLVGNGNVVGTRAIDDAPTAGSTGFATSGGTKEALDAKAKQSQLAYVETGTTASERHEVGSYFCWNGLFYRTTVTINANDPITPNANCVLATVGNEIYKGNNIFEIRIPANSSVTINTNNSDDTFAAIIIVRGTQASVYGAWIFSGYSVLTGGRARVVQLDNPGNCSLSVGTTSRTIVISNSSSDTGTKAFVQVLSQHKISTT